MNRLFFILFLYFSFGVSIVFAQKKAKVNFYNTMDLQTNEWSNVVFINGSNRIEFQFDTYKDYYMEYEMAHFDYNWEKKSPLFKSEYISGAIVQPIYPKFVTTNQTSYTEYHGYFPDFDTDILLSGNYMLYFLMPNFVNDSIDTLFQRKMYVVDALTPITVTGPFGNERNLYKADTWDINVELDKSLSTDYSSGEWKMAIVTNYRDDKAIYITKPLHHKFKGWVYRMKNPLLKKRPLYFKLNTDLHLPKLKRGKQEIQAPTYIYELAKLSNLSNLGTWSKSYKTESSEYLRAKLQFDLRKYNVNPKDSLFIVGKFNDYTKSKPLKKRKTGIYTSSNIMKEGDYSFTLFDQNLKPVLLLDNNQNFQENVFQFFLYFKSNHETHYTIVGYKKLKI